MSAYERIVCAIDLGPQSEAVLERAARIAADCSASVTVVHVVDYVPPLGEDHILPPLESVEADLLAAARKRLDALFERIGVPEAEKHDVQLLSGKPANVIADLAERLEADLVVIGTHGRHGMRGLLGSTTDRVLQRAGCDVLVVH